MGLIDGKLVSERRRALLRERVQTLVARGIQPCVLALSVREDHGWSVYLKGQASACAAVGILHRQMVLPPGSTQDDLLERIESLNLDPAVHGILLQSPLGEGFDAFQAQARLSPDKDVEGVGPANLGLLFSGRPALAPCTALSAVALAKEAIPDLRGVEAVVIGASIIVGKPVAQLLTAAGATVTLCQITTKDVQAHSRRADLVVVAVGKAGLVKPDWIKPGAVVVDVGINRLTGPDGKSITVGDVDPAVATVAGALTPVPGGVGSLTTTILLESTVDAAERLGFGAPALDPTALTRLLGGADLPAGAAERVALLLARHLPGLAGVAASGTAFDRRLAAIRGGAGALILDGAMGSELIDRGIAPQAVAAANLDHPDLVLEVHRAYRHAGAEVLTTNTFGANRFQIADRDRLLRTLTAGARLARQAADGALILGSIGPLGPVVGAELTPTAAADAYAEVALALADAGVDGFALETMPSTDEAAAALLGIRRISRLPVVVSRAIERADPAELVEFARRMEEGGAAAVGVNCAAGPRTLLPVVATLAGASRLPILARPNAGFPTRDGAMLRYHLRPEYLVAQARSYLAAGVGILGGCCGVGPRHIQALAALRGEVPGLAVPVRLVDAATTTVPEHPLLTALLTGGFPTIALVAGRLAPAEAAAAATRLSKAGVSAVGLLTGWPGSPRGPRLVAALAHAAQAAERPGVLELVAGEVTLAEAEERLLSAHLLGIRLVLIDAGVFAGAPRFDHPRGADALALLWLVRRLNEGRGLAGSRLDHRASFVAGVRVPMTDIRHGEYAAAGAAFLTIPPVYEPPRFRARLAELGEAGLPVLAEILLLPDAATADELDNELPALSVPAALHDRLAADPDEDVRGVLRFLSAWRGQVAGLCVLVPDARTGPAETVLRSL